MRVAELRAAYLEYFEALQHQQVGSSSLVPHNDPTLLFVNAGMVPFKDALLGHEDLGYHRATSAQRCVRAGGKHNDLENVGYTDRHLTFFEMMGNFSFGDYFKEETITWAWRFVTEVMKLPVERLCVTYHPTDNEAYDFWTKTIGLPAEKVIPHEDNFWAMGDTGPCGPCTELFYDHGPEVAGGPPGSPDEDGDRYLEFWNLVFPQFDRAPDGTLNPLPKPGVDTGMGLERMAAILQGVHSVFETDLFRGLIHKTAEFAGITDETEMLANPSLRVIADHIRSSAFLITDGIMPGSEDRSYVLRRIIRRALRHGHKLGIQGAFFHKLVPTLAQEMGEAYPVLREQQQQISDALAKEEQRFSETLSQGMELLSASIAGLKGSEIPGDVAFRLYDTYGFPVDLTADVARERNLSVDMEGFESAMEEQRNRARAAAKFDATLSQRIRLDSKAEFLGYDGLKGAGQVLNLYLAEEGGEVKPVETLNAGQAGVVVLDRTPFYAESGGQVGDAGVLQGANVEVKVLDTVVSADQHLHQATVVRGSLAVGDTLDATVSADQRRATALNHSATHLLHAALRSVLGGHVQQKGSLVDATRLRFDFSHNEPVSSEQLKQIEALVNEKILGNSEVSTQLLSYDDAIKAGAMALFGEKYGDEVRVLGMGDGFSVELCGGTHVQRTGDIGLLKIFAETGIASGVRRIEAYTGANAHAYINEGEGMLEQMAVTLRGNRTDLVTKVEALQKQQRDLAKQIERLQGAMAANQGADLASEALEVSGVKVLAARVEGDSKALMSTLDNLKSKLERCVVVLAAVEDGKISLIAGVSKDLTKSLKAGDAVNLVGAKIGAKGGGRPDMARAGGGSDVGALPAALELVAPWVAETLGS